VQKRKFNLTDMLRFSNRTDEEKMFYSQIKNGLGKRFSPGQQIKWADFYNWLQGFLEQPVFACFVVDVFDCLFQEKIIIRKHKYYTKE